MYTCMCRCLRRQGQGIRLHWSPRRLGVAWCWCWDLNSGPPERLTSALKHWAISPALAYANSLFVRRCAPNITQNCRNHFYREPSPARRHGNPKMAYDRWKVIIDVIRASCHPYCSSSGWQSFPCPRSMTRITCLNKMSTSYIMQGNGTPSFKYHHHPRMSCPDSPPLFRAVHLPDPAWVFSGCQGDRLFLRTVTTLDNYNARERLPEETKKINTSARQATPCNWGRSWGLCTQRAAASPPDGKKIEMRIQGSDSSQQLSTKEDGCLSFLKATDICG